MEKDIKNSLKKSNFDLQRLIKTLEPMHTRCGYKALLVAYTVVKNPKYTELKVEVYVDSKSPIEYIFNYKGETKGHHIPEYDLFMKVEL